MFGDDDTVNKIVYLAKKTCNVYVTSTTSTWSILFGMKYTIPEKEIMKLFVSTFAVFFVVVVASCVSVKTFLSLVNGKSDKGKIKVVQARVFGSKNICRGCTYVHIPIYGL